MPAPARTPPQLGSRHAASLAKLCLMSLLNASSTRSCPVFITHDLAASVILALRGVNSLDVSSTRVSSLIDNAQDAFYSSCPEVMEFTV